MSRQVASRQTTPVEVDDGSAPILHVDMDAFFASVELLDHPELVHLPVAVAHEGPRSVVSAANYPARKYGVRSALPLGVARARCPGLVVLPPRRQLYRRFNAIVMGIFTDVTPAVEPLSIDEAFLDVSGARRLFGSPGRIAQSLRERIVAETGLTCSVGVAATKFVAKVASTQAKPDGLLIVPAGRTLEFLHPLPVSALWGVGQATASALAKLGLETIGDVADVPERVLARAVGPAASRQLLALSHGVDPRRVALVSEPREEKSLSQETTFEQDVSDAVQVERHLRLLARAVARRARAAGVTAATISVKLRRSDFHTLSRARTLSAPTDVGETVANMAVQLYHESGLSGIPLRLVGVRMEHVRAASAQASMEVLWDDEEKWREADRALDALDGRFGAETVKPASALRTPRASSFAGPRTAGEGTAAG